MTAHPFDDVFSDLCNPGFTAQELEDFAALAYVCGSADSLIASSERSQFIERATTYGACCMHSQQWHDGGLGACRFEGCGCTCWFPEAR